MLLKRPKTPIIIIIIRRAWSGDNGVGVGREGSRGLGTLRGFGRKGGSGRDGDWRCRTDCRRLQLHCVLVARWSHIVVFRVAGVRLILHRLRKSKTGTREGVR